MGNNPSLARSPANSIFVWLPIISAGTGFFPSAGARVVRESSKIVSMLASLAAIIIIIDISIITTIIVILQPRKASKIALVEGQTLAQIMTYSSASLSWHFVNIE